MLNKVTVIKKFSRQVMLEFVSKNRNDISNTKIKKLILGNLDEYRKYLVAFPPLMTQDSRFLRIVFIQKRKL